MGFKQNDEIIFFSLFFFIYFFAHIIYLILNSKEKSKQN